MNQPKLHMCPLHPEPPSRLPPHPVPLGCPRAPALGALFHALNLHWSFLLQVLLDIVVFWSLSLVRLFATPGTAACQASLSFTISQNLLKLMSIKSVTPSKVLGAIQSIGSSALALDLPVNILV